MTPRSSGAFKKLLLAENEEGRLAFSNTVAPILKECNHFVFIYNNSTDCYIKYFYIKYFLCARLSTCIIPFNPHT